MLLTGLQTVLVTVIALLPIANPVSTAALFLGVTADMTADERKSQALMACAYMFGILVSFFLAGTVIMEFFGISIPGLRIAGGLVIAFIGFRMLFPDASELSEHAENEAIVKKDVAFTPIAMPSLSGPGSIAVVISMSSEIDHWVGYPSVVIAILITAVVSWIVLRFSSLIIRVLGINGVHALSRIMGFLLICIGIQFVINGVSDLLVDPTFLPTNG